MRLLEWSSKVAKKKKDGDGPYLTVLKRPENVTLEIIWGMESRSYRFD